MVFTFEIHVWDLNLSKVGGHGVPLFCRCHSF